MTTGVLTSYWKEKPHTLRVSAVIFDECHKTLGTKKDTKKQQFATLAEAHLRASLVVIGLTGKAEACYYLTLSATLFNNNSQHLKRVYQVMTAVSVGQRAVKEYDLNPADPVVFWPDIGEFIKSPLPSYGSIILFTG